MATSVLSTTILDAGGAPVEGAILYAYLSATDISGSDYVIYGPETALSDANGDIAITLHNNADGSNSTHYRIQVYDAGDIYVDTKIYLSANSELSDIAGYQEPAAPPAAIPPDWSPLGIANGGTGATTAAAARSNIGAQVAGSYAASGANSDITSLSSPAIGSATATTQTAGDNSTKVATTAYADAAIAAIPTPASSPTVRQTVLSGPVDSNGFAAFGGSTGSTTVTTSGTLKATASAGGDANYTGSITNPSWTGLSTNGTMYLYLDITSAGVVTTGSTTLAPVYQFGGTYSTVNGQNTYNIQEATMKAGNGSTATQVYRVFVGEVTVSGGVVTGIVWYALMGRYISAAVTPLPGAGVSVVSNSKLGCATGVRVTLKAVCLTSEYGFTKGQIVSEFYGVDAGYAPITLRVTTNTVGFTTPAGSSLRVFSAVSGISSALTLSYWAYFVCATRSW